MQEQHKQKLGSCGKSHYRQERQLQSNITPCCKSISALIPMQEDPERIIIFRGLRVRMCVVTGVPDPSASALAKPVDKYPALLPILKAMATIAQGGQVLCASSTYTLINSRLTDIARRVPEQPNAPFNSMQSALHG